MAAQLKDIVSARHPHYIANAPFWQYFADAVAGGPDYGQKVNPLFRPLLGWIANANRQGMNRYLVQHSLEDVSDYLARLYKCPTVALTGPAVDMLAGTVGSPDSVVFDVGDDFQALLADADLMGDSLLQFLLTVRAHAAVYGHSFILCDSTRAQGQVVTEADAIAQGIRPYFREISPVDLLNWRLDANGKPVEILFRVPVEQPGSILEQTKALDQLYEYRYWDASRWMTIRQVDGENYEIADEGQNPIGEVPITPLYHKRLRPFQGEPLVKEASRYQQLLTNWLSDLDVTMVQQSFSQACLRSDNPPSQVGIGATKVIHLHPDKKEGDNTVGAADFFYRSPDAAPLANMWQAFFDVLDLANQSMSLRPDPVSDKSHPESGISRAWRWHTTEKRLVAMAVNEEHSVKELFRLAAKWKGQDSFTGTIQYSTHFDLSALEDDIQNMLSLQAASIPQSAQTELKSRIVRKALPNLPPDKQSSIDAELKKMNSVQSLLDRRILSDSVQDQG